MRRIRKGDRRRMRPAAIASLALALGVLAGGFASAADPVKVDVPFTPLQTLYLQDFEGGDGGYTTGGAASWQFGEAVSPPSPSAGQGPNLWGTTLAGNYANNECGYLQSAPIDLSGVPAGADLPDGVTVARLLFRHWMHVEQNYDAGLVMASADGVTWKVVTPVGGYTHNPLTAAETCFGIGATGTAYSTPSSPAPAADAWKLAEFDVTEFLGGNLHLRWVFASDSSVVYRGWYVDDVAVQLGVGANLTVSPPAPGDAEVPFTAGEALYAEDFEATDGGWTATGSGAWEWGAPADPPTTLAGSLNVWGTRLLSDYLTNECATLTSPAIELPGQPASGARLAQLSFNLWRSLENGYDGALLQVSTNGGGSWKTLTPDGGYDRTLFTTTTSHACLGTTGANPVWSGPATAPKSDEWSRKTVDMTGYLGSTVKLRFVFASDGDTERRGVYIDDVIIQAGVGAKAGLGDVNCLDAPGWTSGGTNSSWCYGVPTTGPVSAKPVYATNLGGQYNASECSAIVSPAIPVDAVVGLGSLTLTFEHFMDSASTDDGGIVQVSDDDGTTWRTVTPVGDYNSTLSTSARNCVAPGSATQKGFSGGGMTAYQLREARLTGFTSGETVRVRFIFGSGSSLNDFGWYIKTVGVNRGGANVPLLP